MAKSAVRPLPILTVPNPILTRVCRAIPHINRHIQILAEQMWLTLSEVQGLGLAAPQVGKTWRMFVTPNKVYLNPRVLRAWNYTVSEESCLSIPGVTVRRSRCNSVLVQAFDMDGKVFDQEASGLEAIVLQHEIDHLDGILILPGWGDAYSFR